MAKYYYNGVLLPEIPSEVLAEYPYLFILLNHSANKYRLYACSHPFYASNISTVSLRTFGSNSEVKEVYGLECTEDSDAWTLNSAMTTNPSSAYSYLYDISAYGETYNILIWTNTNIPKGSEDSTEIYMRASEPILDSEDDCYKITKTKLSRFGYEIRRISGKTEPMETNEMLDILHSAEGFKGDPVLQNKTITENGTYSADSGYDALGEVVVNVASSGGAELNIHYGDTEPSDTSKLWVKCAEPSKVLVSPSVIASGKSSKIKTAVSETTGLNMCGASVGKKIYLFGGGATSSYSNIIQVFDTETETIKTISTVLPDAMYGGMAAAVGANIYIFGGLNSSGAKNTIYKFNTETEELTTLSVTLSQAIRFGAGIVVIGNKIYVVCGATTEETKGYFNAQVLDVETEALTVTESVCGTAYSYATCCAIGTDIYLFGGMRGTWNYESKITKFDTLTQRYSSLSVSLPTQNGRMCIGVVGNKLYLIGGKYNSANIVVFDLETKTIETLSNTFAKSIYGAVSCTVGNTIYIVGGYDNANSPYIYKYVVSMEVASDEMQIQSTLTNNLFNIINGDVSFLIGVANVYKGNTDGVGEKVDAYLYKDEAWTPI